MQVYFDLIHFNNGYSSNGSAWIIPVRYGLYPGISAPLLSRDCGSRAELKHVIEYMRDDLKALARKGERILPW